MAIIDFLYFLIFMRSPKASAYQSAKVSKPQRVKQLKRIKESKF